MTDIENTPYLEAEVFLKIHLGDCHILAKRWKKRLVNGERLTFKEESCVFLREILAELEDRK